MGESALRAQLESRLEDLGPPKEEMARPRLRRGVLRFICETVSRLKYGQVIIYVQDGEIIQIDTTEKVRFRPIAK